MTKRQPFTTHVLAAIAAVVSLAYAHSAKAADPAAAPTAQPANPSALGEVIVTAQHRKENLQRVAIPVAAVPANELITRNVTDTGQLGQLVPAVTVLSGGTGNIIFIRGVGNFTVSPNSDPAINFSYDGIYIGRPTSTNGLFFDLDRIEVLKGPQGTLYGRNATGGVINVIPAQPVLGQYSGYATVSYGNYNAWTAEGAVNVPLGDKAALRVSADTIDHSGYLQDGTNDEQSTSARVQAKGELTPQLTARLSFDYNHQGGSGAGSTILGNYAFDGATGAYVFHPSGLPNESGLYSPADQAYSQTVISEPAGRVPAPLAPRQYQNNNFYGVNAEINYQASFGTFTLVPAWRLANLDYLTGAADFPYYEPEVDQQYSVEARFNGARIGIFDYSIGAYYYNEKINNQTALSVTSIADWLKEQFTTDSYAGFAHVTIHATDQLRFTGGVRYTDDQKSYLADTTSGIIDCLGLACPAAPAFPLVRNPSLVPFPFPAKGGAPIFDFPADALIIRTDSTYNTHLNDGQATFHGGVEYDVAPRSLLYATVDTGYRSGGFSPAVGFETYQPEHLTAYTVGSKNRFLDDRLQVNVELFDWEYNNEQVTHVGADLSGNVANFTQNIGQSRIQGFEVDARALITPDDLLSADVQYLNTRTLSFEYQQLVSGGPPVTGCRYGIDATKPTLYNVNCAGFPNYNSPTWTLNLAAQHTFRLGPDKVVISADTQFKTSEYVGFEYLPSELMPANWMTNAQLMFAPNDEHWSVELFVRNLEGRQFFIGGGLNPTTDILIGGASVPRTYGVRLSASF